MSPPTETNPHGSPADVVRWITRARVVAVVRTGYPDRLVELARALCAGGVCCIEVTMTVPNALEGIRLVSQELAGRALVGAGSVTDAATAEAAVEAGARFVVSPVFKREVVEATHAAGAAAMPGGFTPTELLAAQEGGADIVKVFPADVLGVAFIRGVRAPLPRLMLMPTGGVTIENAAEWLRAGAVAVGVGSALVDEAAIARGDWALITHNAGRLRDAVRDV
jgi:2-dehydro-3-deoxyphosphogluconate aldolase/(4S)-4-hydroxy-2-oxoglutarate aldolase